MGALTALADPGLLARIAIVVLGLEAVAFVLLRRRLAVRLPILLVNTASGVVLMLIVLAVARDASSAAILALFALSFGLHALDLSARLRR